MHRAGEKVQSRHTPGFARIRLVYSRNTPRGAANPIHRLTGTANRAAVGKSNQSSIGAAMILFGIRERTLRGPSYNGLACPHCRSTRFETHGRQRYFHLYWVPTIPLSRSIVAECASCGHTMPSDSLPAHLVNRTAPAIFTTGRTLSRFIGLVIAGSILVLLALALA